MRILILSLQYPPDVNSTGMLMKQLARWLHGRGHQLHVVTTFPHYAGFRIEAAYRGRWIERVHEEGIEVSRLWLFTSGRKHQMTHRLISYLTFNAGALLAAQASPADYDIILAPSASFFTGATAGVLGALRGCPFVYNVQDIYPDVPVRAGQLRRQWQVRGLDRIGLAMMRRAARVTVISEQQRATLISKGVDPDRIVLIPNFVDIDRMRPLPRDRTIEQRFGWSNRFIVMHGGNIGFAYDFDAILDAAELLRSKPDVRFVLIGDGVRKTELETRVRERMLTNVQFLPFQPEEDLPAIRSCADLQLSLYRRGSSEASLPSKLYEIMASGRAVIASAEPLSAVARLVMHAQAGVVIEPENAEQLARSILALQTDAAWRARLADNGRSFVTAHHSLDAAGSAYESLFEAVLHAH